MCFIALGHVISTVSLRLGSFAWEFQMLYTKAQYNFAQDLLEASWYTVALVQWTDVGPAPVSVLNELFAQEGVWG